MKPGSHGSHGSHGRGSRILVWAAALGLLMGLVPAQGGLAAGAKPAAHPGAFKLPAAHAVAVAPVHGGRLALPAAPAAPRAAQALPGAGTGIAELGGASGGAGVRAGTLPVRVAPGTGGGPSPSRVTVDVADQKTAHQAGVNGLLLRVRRADGRTDAGQVSVSVDYSAFEHAYGGNWASSLRLVAMPACAFTTPQDQACQSQTVLPSSNDAVAHQVSALVPLGSASASVAPASGTTSLYDFQLASTTSGGTVLAATAGPSGPQGDYTATPLKTADTWSGGGPTGDFTWSYPISVPPAFGGKGPTVGLAYDSASMDGTTASYNSQSSWVGAGFDYRPGFITRGFEACKDAGVSSDVGDLCYRNDNATMSLNGQTEELIHDAGGAWHLRHDDGSRVELLTGASNGDLSGCSSTCGSQGEHWRVTTVDGTVYDFGLNRLPGWTSSHPETNSAWQVPVYGPSSGDPCYNSAGFASSWCNQTWQWNLDMVTDPQGNATTFFYDTESNYYARHASATTGNGTPTQYTRSGHLTTIHYGARASNVFTNYPLQVAFGTGARCTNTSGGCGGTDVPWNLNCNSGSSCTGDVSPSFWSNVKLTSITTSVYESTAWVKVDTYALDSGWFDDGDGTWDLVLNGITRTGQVGGSASLPKVTFGYVALHNRVDTNVVTPNLPLLNRARLSKISTESGAVVSVTYSNPGCTASTEPAPDSNTTTCFPQWWSLVQPPPNCQSPCKPDWFNKYLVTDVSVSDSTGGSVTELTHYDYSGPDGKGPTAGGAWHFAENSGLVKDKWKTWDDFRGFRQVTTTQGASGDPQTRTQTTFMRGMDGNPTAAGGTQSVSVPDSQKVLLTDSPALAGFERESITYNGPGGAEVSGSIMDPWTSQTGKNARSVTSDFVETGASHDRVDLTGGAVRTTEVDHTFNNQDLEVMVRDKGDVSSPTPRCTITTYAQNPGAWMLAYPAEVQSTGQDCPYSGLPPTSGTLALPTDPSLVISDVRSSYDGQAWGSAPLAWSSAPAGSAGGQVTRTGAAVSGGSSPGFVTTATMAYDVYGRLTSSADALGRTTTTAYTPGSGNAAAITQIVVTDPAGDTETSNIDPARGLPTSKLDLNSERTDLTYDPLGRLTAVFLPAQSGGSNASVKFAYPQVNAVTTSTLLPSGTAYKVGYQIFDGQMRLRQTQEPAIGATGRVITDTYYNSLGEQYKTTRPYYDNQASAGTSLVTPVLDSNVPGEDVTTFDGAGRPTADTFEAYGVPRWQSSTAYGGDRATVTPPSGGTAATTIVDARGQKIQLCQYHNLSPSGNCDAANSDSTTYSYFPNGLLEQVTDPAGNHWSYSYDFRGSEVSQSDPDAGTTSSTYDNALQLLTTTDANGQVLSYVYDNLGRTTQKWAGAVNTGSQLAAWTYYTSGTAKGMLASRTSYQGGAAYKTTIDSYDVHYEPTSVTYNIPASEGGLAGTYKFTATYNPDGSLYQEGYPAGGGLSAETVAHTYDGTFGTPLRTIGQNDYVEQSQYTVFGQLAQLALGTSTSAQWSYDAFVYDLSTFRLQQQLVTQDATPSVQAANIAFSYDATGNLLSAANTPSGNALADNVECYQYGPLRRLSEAWAQSSTGCAASPSASAMGGASPYWESFAYDDLTGNRTSLTRHSPSGSASDTLVSNSYPTAGSPQPHFMLGQAISGPSGKSNVSQAHDLAGNVTNITQDLTSSKTLTWTPDGHLAQISDSVSGNTSTFSYDTDGSQLTDHNNSSWTLHLPGQEISYDPSSKKLTATRYYSHGGATVAARTNSALDWLISDPHGTNTIAIDASSQTVTRRYMDPFGASRSPAPSAWPGDRAFVGGTVDSGTGLTNLGARTYNPADGQFLSPDPIVDLGDPQQMNAYAYASNNPTTMSDPSGLSQACPGGGCVPAPPPNDPTPPPNTPPPQHGNPSSPSPTSPSVLHQILTILKSGLPGTTGYAFYTSFLSVCGLLTLRTGADGPTAFSSCSPFANMGSGVGQCSVTCRPLDGTKLAVAGIENYLNTVVATYFFNLFFNPKTGLRAADAGDSLAQILRDTRQFTLRSQADVWQKIGSLLFRGASKLSAGAIRGARSANLVRLIKSRAQVPEGTDPPAGGADPPAGGMDPPAGGMDPPAGGMDPPAGGMDAVGGMDPGLPIVGIGGCSGCSGIAWGADLAHVGHGIVHLGADLIVWLT